MRICKLGLVLVGLTLFTFPSTALAQKQTRDEMVIEDRQALLNDEFWIYDDLDEAFQVAKKENKPLMVVLRCIP